jgi:hypothetical protein
MLCRFRLNGEEIDSLELKVLLITKGINVAAEVYEQYRSLHRISQNPMECNCLILPGNVVVHMTDVGPTSPFRLEAATNGNASLSYEGTPVTDVSFPPKTDFYRQCTSTGRPFLGMAVLQGLDVLSFPYLWSCVHARGGQACQFCHCGGFSEQRARDGIAEIFDKYKIEPPGGIGFNVCLCRDTWNCCSDILARKRIFVGSGKGG